MDPSWTALVAFVAVAAAVPLGTLAFAMAVRSRPKTIPPTRPLTYECGEEPEHGAQIRFHPRYFVVALLFVLFDVEAAFLLPWALQVKEAGDAALIEVIVFVVILMLGWAYAVRKGALKWH